jgi:hypothetical protein
MIEFYSDRSPVFVISMRRWPAVLDESEDSGECARIAPMLMVALVLALSGCAQTGTGPAGATPEAPGIPARPTAPPLPATTEPPPPAINLSGFPLSYRQGYADGCATATGPERKDAARFGGDGNYRTGWTDGVALCKKK